MKNKTKKQVKNINNSNEKLLLSDVSISKRTVYCECSQRSLMKPISETEYECFDCGKEVKQKTEC